MIGAGVMPPEQGTAGAAEMRERMGRVRDALSSNVTEMTALLAPARIPDRSRLNHILLETNHVVHAGHRLIGESGRMRSDDLAAAGNIPEAQAAMHRAWAALAMPINQLRLDLNKWTHVESMLRPQVKQRRLPLIETYEKLPGTVITRETVGDVLFADLHTLLNPLEQDEDARAHGCHRDIPLPQSRFLRLVHAARRCMCVLKPGQPTQFLDVGCGAGLKVISAAPYFDRCAGLEYDPGYAQLAAKLFRGLPHDRCRAIPGDALTWDGYHNFDVLYFFRPIRDDALLAQMEQHILDSVPKGTLLIAPYRTFVARAERNNCANVTADLWLTGSDAAGAARLRRAAELIGTDVPLQAGANVPLIWDPLIEASRRRGFEPTLRWRHPLEDDSV